MFPWSISWKASTPTSIRSSGSSGPLLTLAIHSSLHCYIPAVSHCVNLHLYSFCYAFWDADSSYLHLHVSRTSQFSGIFGITAIGSYLMVSYFGSEDKLCLNKTNKFYLSERDHMFFYNYLLSFHMTWRLRSPILTEHLITFLTTASITVCVSRLVYYFY